MRDIDRERLARACNLAGIGDIELDACAEPSIAGLERAIFTLGERFREAFAARCALARQCHHEAYLRQCAESDVKNAKANLRDLQAQLTPGV